MHLSAYARLALAIAIALAISTCTSIPETVQFQQNENQLSVRVYQSVGPISWFDRFQYAPEGKSYFVYDVGIINAGSAPLTANFRSFRLDPVDPGEPSELPPGASVPEDAPENGPFAGHECCGWWLDMRRSIEYKFQGRVDTRWPIANIPPGETAVRRIAFIYDTDARPEHLVFTDPDGFEISVSLRTPVGAR
ncbi:MAG: hypothetical protein H7A22_13755 [Spirochaetales bacterium]|nr:hypothetical protein [Spirochaetales bacterium]